MEIVVIKNQNENKNGAISKSKWKQSLFKIKSPPRKRGLSASAQLTEN